MPDVVVKKSGIRGAGVFAARDFMKGETVIDWAECSEQLSKEDVDKLPAPKKKYVSFIGKGKWALLKAPGKYVNHSCDSNTKSANGKDLAVRDIIKGEEITADYIHEKVPSEFKCRCSAAKCRGTIKPQK